jgi:hypothetical protein
MLMSAFGDFLREAAPWLTGAAKAAAGFVGLLGLVPWRQTLGARQPPKPPTTTTTATGGDGGLTNEDWLLSGTWLHLASSNVEATRYLWNDQILEIQYKGVDPSGNGYIYQYMSISPEEADDFIRSASPGRWVWSELRELGSRTGYKKEYVRLHGFAGVPRTPRVVGTISEAEALKRTGGKIPMGELAPWQQQNAPWGKSPWQP